MSRYTPRNFKYCDSDFMDSGLGEPMNKLAHYEDLEEQGRLIELPCKVGSRVYFVVSSGEIWSNTLDDLNTVFEFKDLIGKVYFLTKEEAEAKLEEMKEGAK